MILLGMGLPLCLFAQHQMTNFGNLTFHAGAEVTLYGDFRNNGSFSDTSVVVNFQGTNTQIISGTSVPHFNNCKMDNANGVSLQQAITVKNNIHLVNGSLTLNNQSLSVLNGNINGITRLSGTVISEQPDNSGRIIWSIGNNTGIHTYPFAAITGEYIPFVMDLVSGDMGNVTIATYHTGANNLPYPSYPDVVTHVNNALGADNSANTVDRFWQIDKDGPSGIANVTYTATSTEVGGIANLFAYRWNTPTQGWELPPCVQTSTTSSVQVDSLSTFSPWTLAGNGMALPVELLSFTASLNSKRQVDLDWVTTSEINNDFFTVERSIDGIHFEKIGETDGAGNSNVQLLYHTIDPDPYSGLSYYRLMQTDFDAQQKYSQVQTIYIGNDTEVTLTLFPNPSNGNFTVSVTGLNNEYVIIKIIDVTGKIYFVKTMFAESNLIYQVDEVEKLAPGLYHLELIAGDKSYYSKFVVN